MIRQNNTRYGRRYDGRYDDDYQDPYADNRRFDSRGFDQFGFDREGFDMNGFDQEGYDRQGFDRDGYDRHGFHMDDYDRGNRRNIRIVRDNDRSHPRQYPNPRPDRSKPKTTKQTKNKKSNANTMIVCRNCGETVNLKDCNEDMDMCILCVRDNTGPGFFATRRESKPLPLSTWAALIFIGMVVVGALFR